jgi:flagellar basal body-associated protein FliL
VNIAVTASDPEAKSKRRANIRLAVIIGTIALGFYTSMFLFMGA